MEFKNFKGKKTYIVAVATACYALGGAVAGFMDWSSALTILLGAGGLGTMAAKVNRFFSSLDVKVDLPTQ